MKKNLIKIGKALVGPGIGIAIAAESRYNQYQEQQTSRIEKISNHEQLDRIEGDVKSFLEKEKNINQRIESVLEENRRLTQEINISFKEKSKNLENLYNDKNLIPSNEASTSVKVSEQINTQSEITEMSNTINSHDEKVKDIVTDLVDNIEKSSNIFDLEFLLRLLDDYRNFLTTLAPDQTVALMNLFVLYMVLAALVSVCIFLFGNYLIDKLQLEIKFPKIARFIKYRQNLNKAFLYLIIFVVTLFVIFMFIFNLLIVFKLI